jgi:hypothetical protein
LAKTHPHPSHQQRNFPISDSPSTTNLDYPKCESVSTEGAGTEPDTYYHLAVITLEWQALEELLGPERALEIMAWNRKNHYTAIRTAVRDKRTELEELLQRHGIRF